MIAYGRFLLLAALVVVNGLAEDVGTVRYIEGAVFLQEELVYVSEKSPVTVASGQTLRTEYGNAELQVTAGALLRLGRDTNVEILDADESSIDVRLVKGSIILDILKGKRSIPVTVLSAGTTTTISSRGEYRFAAADEGPSALQVRKGKAAIADDRGGHQLKKKQAAEITQQGIVVVSLEDFPADELTAWHDRRSEIVPTDVFVSGHDNTDMPGLPAKSGIFERRGGY